CRRGGLHELRGAADRARLLALLPAAPLAGRVECLAGHDPTRLRQEVQLILAIAVLARSAISSGGTSSTRVAMLQVCPNGSVTLPNRSPQNVFSTGIVIVPPASTTCWTISSTSSTYT